MHVNRSYFVGNRSSIANALVFVILTINTFFVQASISNTTKPNIIVIVADDAGYIDFGFMGSKDLKTPRLDELANAGTIFTDAHVSASVCAPSRAGLMTGRYQQRMGFEANGTGNIGLADDELTLADVLKTEGYSTVALGKWHLGNDDSDHPNARGFDEFYGFLTGSRSYWPIKNPTKDKMLQHNGERVVFDGYMTDILGDKSVDYVKQFKSDPFFMYLAYNAVHTPMHATEEDLALFENHDRQALAAMTWSMDKNIGKLIDELKKQNIYKNTLIFFLSDNGGPYSNTSDNGPLKGNKGNKFEGGHRVPFIMSWPASNNNLGRFDGLTSSLDIFVTSVNAAGVSPSIKPQVDGVDLAPYIFNNKKGEPHDYLFWRKLSLAAARFGDYKLVRLDDYGYRFYNLEKDIGETHDLTTEKNREFETLNHMLEIWEDGVMQPLWREKNWESTTRHIQRSLMENREPSYRNPSQRNKFLSENKQQNTSN